MKSIDGITLLESLPVQSKASKGGRPALPPEQRCDHRVSLRLDEERLYMLGYATSVQGLSAGEVMRRALDMYFAAHGWTRKRWTAVTFTSLRCGEMSHAAFSLVWQKPYRPCARRARVAAAQGCMEMVLIRVKQTFRDAYWLAADAENQESFAPHVTQAEAEARFARTTGREYSRVRVYSTQHRLRDAKALIARMRSDPWKQGYHAACGFLSDSNGVKNPGLWSSLKMLSDDHCPELVSAKQM
jgi:hypothetical protein